MYKPDRVFMHRLKTLDKRLGCYFNDNHNHFVVTYQRPVGSPAEIMLVENNQGGFRQPDSREINTLCEFDTHRTDIKDRLQKGASYMEKYREKQDKEIRDSLREATLDDKQQLKSSYAKATNDGKCNSAFRRV